MILITGGLGFIGSHTARALLDLGESCVLAQRRVAEPPAFLADPAGRRVITERVDITDAAALAGVGERHPITGIVHLAGAGLGGPDPVRNLRVDMDGLLNVVQAARDWGVSRVGVASTIGVYGGVESPGALTEDLPLPMSGPHLLPAFKKISEIAADHLAGTTGIQLLSYRISAIWGPLGRTASPFFPVPQLIHAAVRNTAPDFSMVRGPAHAGDGIDLCYVKDCGRAIALLQTAGHLRHRTYNIASGRFTSYGEVAAAIREVIPGARADLAAGRDPAGPGHDVCLDITRLRQDTGYEPAYDTGRAVADYIGWLRGGNER